MGNTEEAFYSVNSQNMKVTTTTKLVSKSCIVKMEISILNSNATLQFLYGMETEKTLEPVDTSKSHTTLQ